jgi:HEAT repeat protein
LTAKSAQVLGDLHDLRAEKALLDMLNFKEERLDIQLFVRMRAADALGRSRSASGGKALAEMVGETEPTARQVYAWSLSRIGGRDALPKVVASATKGGWDARIESLKAIAMLGDEREAAAMDKFGKDEAKTYEAECKSDDFGGTKECAEVAASTKKHEQFIANFSKALDAAKACKSDAVCWAKKLDDPTLVVRERAAYEVGRSGNAALVGELTKRLREKDLDARLAIIQGCDWLIGDSKDALKAAQAALPDLQKQLAEERGKTEFVKVNEDLRRLAVKLGRG